MVLKREKKHSDGLAINRACVCFICVEGHLGGAEKSLLLLGEVVKQQYSIIAICPAGSKVEKHFRQMRIECRVINEIARGIGIIGKGLYFFKTSWQVWKIIKKTRPAIIHANNSKAALVSILAGKLSGAKFVFHCRDMAGSRATIRLSSWAADSVIAVSKAVRWWLIKKDADKKKIEVIYNGVKTQKDRVRKKFINEKMCFGNVGQFVGWKRQGLFIEAAEIVYRQRSDVRFCIVGDDVFGREGKYKKQLMQQVQDSEVAGCLKLLGWQNDMEDVWEQIDCLVHTAENEPFGRVIIEAMEHEIAVVALDSGGCAEIITDKMTGILVENEDAVELAGVMMQIAGNRDLARRLGQAGRREVCEKFSFETIGHKVMEIYERLLA
jgi:glycosyltransferase involved in cell wall biosynthesis